MHKHFKALDMDVIHGNQYGFFRIPVKNNEIFDTSNENLDVSLSLLDGTPLKKVRASRISNEGKKQIQDVTSKLANVISVALDDPYLVSNSSNCQSCGH